MKNLWNSSLKGWPLKLWFFLFLLALWRVFISQKHGLGVDEAHYVLYGLNLDWSYFDHPPMVGWVQGLFYLVFGKSELAARLPAIASSFLASLLIYKLVYKITNDEPSSLWATLGYNTSFLPAALGIMLVPDTLLFIFVLWLIFICDKLLKRENPVDWLELGICLGLAGLTKYTAVFLLFSLLGIVFTHKALSQVKISNFLLAVLVSLIFISPVFYWNVKHQWISFAYQQSHVMGSAKLSPGKFVVFLITQLVAYNPFVIIAAVRGFQISRQKWSTDVLNSLWIAGVTLFFFVYTSLKDEVLPHWTLIGWGLIIPLGTALAIQNKAKIKWAIILSSLILLFVMLELSFQFIKFPPYQSPYADLIGWRELHEDLKPIVEKEIPGSYALGVTNWTLGSRAKYYLEGLAQVFVLDDRFDQFDLWEKNQRRVKNLLILSWRGFDLSKVQEAKCGSIESVKERVFSINGSPVNSVRIFWCRNYTW